MPMKIAMVLFYNNIMKIAHLVSTFPPHIGGMGAVCYEEVNRMTTGNEVSVFTLKYPGVKYNDNDFGFSVRRLRPMSKVGDGGIIFGLPNFLRGFDIVHLHYPFYGALGSLVKAKKLLGFKLVVTYHMDPQGSGFKGALQKIYDSMYSRKIFALADKIIAVDADYFNKSKFGRYIGKEKIIFLPNGVDTYEFSGQEGDWSALGRPELIGKKVILFVGNLLPVKNFEFLINLLPKLQDNIILMAVGGGYDEERLKKITAGTPYENRIVFIGSGVSRNDLPKYYSYADLVAVPSLSESFSLVVVEAMSCGAIVLASDVAGIRRRIVNGANGFLSPLNDALAWKDGIERILSLGKEEKKIIKGRARERALQYDWNNHIFSLSEVYRALI